MRMLGTHVLVEYICPVDRISSLIEIPGEYLKGPFILCKVIERGDGQYIKKRDRVIHKTYPSIKKGDLVIVSRWNTQVLFVAAVGEKKKYLICMMEDIVGKVPEENKDSILDKYG